MIRLMVFDLDGTLTVDGSIPQRNREALRTCARRGIRLMIASGRSFEVQTDLVRNTGLDPILASANGARIDASASGPILFESTLTQEQAGSVRSELLSRKVYFQAYARGRTYVFGGEYLLRPDLHHHPAGIVMHGEHPYETVTDPDRLDREGTKGIYKYVVFTFDSDPRLERIGSYFREKGFSVSSSGGDNVEIMSPGTDKGSAVRFVKERLGIRTEEIMAFGDQTNDIPMLCAAGIPVVMGNAVEAVRPFGRIIAPDFRSGGVASVIEKYVLTGDTCIAT